MMKVWYVYGKQCYIKSTLIGIYALVVFVSEMSLFRLTSTTRSCKKPYPRAVSKKYTLHVYVTDQN